MQPKLFTVGTRRFRIRRANKRNLVIEIHAIDDAGGWRVLSYHGTVRSLAIALVDLVGSGHCPDPKGRIAGELAALRLAIETGIDRLAKELAGLDESS